MDEPIIYPEICSPRDDPSNLGLLLNLAVLNDDKDAFLMVVRHPDFHKYRHFLNNRSIFHCDAVRIATAVFEGKTKGIYDVEDMLVLDDMSPIHLAAGYGAAKLTKYLIQRGDSVDTYYDVPMFNLNQASPIDLALESIGSMLFYGRRVVTKDDDKTWTPSCSIMDMLVTLCKMKRRALEVVRLLAQNTQNKERVRQAFIDYATNGKLAHIAALFLAAPDLFLPSPFLSVRDGLLSLEKRTNIEEGMSLLLDVFAAVGDKLVAYIRIEDPVNSEYRQAKVIAFFLREVTYRKQGVSSRDDYFVRFCKPVDMLSSPHVLKLHQNNTLPNSPIQSFQMGRKYMNIDTINRSVLGTCLKLKDAVDVYRAIRNKLSSMSRLRGLFLEIDIKSKEREKYLPEWFPSSSGRNFELVVESFHNKAASTRPKADSKFTLAKSLENKVMQPNKLKSFFSLFKQKKLPVIFKRLIRG